MASLADAPDLVGFFSYSREDDEGSGGKLSKLRDRIQEELRLQLGRTRNDFRLWQDKVAITHGELWEETIKKGISESVFFIPIITPTAVRSSYCKFEFDSFLAREKKLDRNNLIFPILYVPVPTLKDERWRQDPLLSIVGSRQYEDWQNLRHLDASSSEVVALRVQTFCADICRALEQPWLSPEERREAEARRLAEAERGRQQEAEIKQRADEEQRRRKAEAEKRRRDDRLGQEGKLPAKESQHAETQLEQEPQQQVKPWLLPLIGAVAASLPMLFLVALSEARQVRMPAEVFLYMSPMAMINALYGGTAGMLLRRFGIPKAVAIPAMPALFLFLIYLFVYSASFGLLDHWVYVFLLLFFVSAVMCVWSVFSLLSLWSRKQRLRDARMVP